MKKRVNHLNAVKFGFTGGIILGFCLFALSLLAGWFPAWNMLLTEAYGTLGIMAEIYYFVLSFSVILWHFLVFIYAFIEGFVLAYLFAFIYNKLLKV